MKEVLIGIKSVQTGNGQTERMDFTTVGRMFQKDNHIFLRYQEGELLNENEDVTTLLKIQDRQVMLQRTGDRQSRMLIEKGVRHQCYYQTTFGSFTIGVFGETIENALSKAGGRLYLRYTIDADAELVSRNEVEISVKEV